MKVLILAGGYGTRLSEETYAIPKPMVEIGEKPILWHIMKIFSQYGFNEFVVLLGYKGHIIKDFFSNYFLHQSNVTVDLSNNRMEFHDDFSENWKVTMIETGLNTMTGGRVARARRFVGDNPFMLTYGDGVADINIKELVDFHQTHGKMVTVTSVQPEGRCGLISAGITGQVQGFVEKPVGDGGWVNGGFFVCQPEIFGYLDVNSNCIFEGQPLESLAAEKQVFTFKHHGFWKCMDTQRDKNALNKMWENNCAPWKTWE